MWGFTPLHFCYLASLSFFLVLNNNTEIYPIYKFSIEESDLNHGFEYIIFVLGNIELTRVDNQTTS